MSVRGATVRASLALAAVLAGGACVAAAPSAQVRYLSDSHSRRASLEASLVNRDNGYSTLRLARYATGTSGDWDALPEWNPPAEPLDAAMLATPRAPVAAGAAPLGVDAAASSGDIAALRALGEAAFFRYPAQLLDAAEVVTSEAIAARYGLWTDAGHGVGGLVRLRTTDGVTHLAVSCATCHAAQRGDCLSVGVGNDRLDVGALLVDARRGAGPASAAQLAWGPGRLDVTTLDGSEPVRIPDLRPVRSLGYLHHTASVEQRDETSLAVRLETLIITSNGQAVRPPRAIALGLAIYVRSLADGLAARPPQSDAALRGQSLFMAHCSGCHAPPSFTGRPVAIDLVGTDPVVGRSRERGTGTYRVPSLLGVAGRGLLLHDASISSVSELLDPARTGADYRGRLGGPAPGHRFGLDLAAEDRAAIAAFVAGL